LPDFRDTVRALRDDYEGSFDRFWESFHSRPAFAKSSDAILLNSWAMAACYSANTDGSIDLPFDTETGQLREDVWARWLAWDPVRMVDGHADALRGRHGLHRRGDEPALPRRRRAGGRTRRGRGRDPNGCGADPGACGR